MGYVNCFINLEGIESYPVMKRLIYAHGVHVGGGMELLKEVFLAAQGDDKYAFILDARIKDEVSIYDLRNVEYFSPGIYGRLISEIKIWKYQTQFVKILSFNSIPFFLNFKLPVTIYFQNINLIKSPRSRIISHSLRKILFKLLARRVDDFLVQTETVKNALSKVINSPCSVLTLLNDKYKSLYPRYNQSHTSLSAKQFIYVADASPHKNHFLLFKAWQLLSDAYPGLPIKLKVTLPFDQEGLWDKLARHFDCSKLGIENVGCLSRSEVSELYITSDALIFPSNGESLGLPLIEAEFYKIDILASELDFVRDVSNPVETFNPQSAKSIASAIARYLHLTLEKVVVPINASELLEIVFNSDN